MKKIILTEWIKVIAGLIVFSVGIHLTIFANIGLAPWDCLGIGIAKNTNKYSACITKCIISLLKCLFKM